MKNKIFLLSFLVTLCLFLGVANFNKLETLFRDKKQHLYTPDYKKDHRLEIDLIYIGSSSCHFSNTNKLYKSVDAIKSLVQKKAIKNNVGFSTIGIATDRNPAQGIKHLSKLGNFNEIVAGNGWNNIGITRYVENMGAEASTPQVILTFRTYSSPYEINVIKEKRVLSLKGERQIINWYQKGAQLPQKFIQEIQKSNENNH
jgi:hypothetical protein